MTTTTTLNPRELEESYRRHVASAADPRPALKWLAEHPDFAGYVLRLHLLANTARDVLATGTLDDLATWIDHAHAELAQLPDAADDVDSWWQPHLEPSMQAFLAVSDRLDALKASLWR